MSRWTWRFNSDEISDDLTQMRLNWLDDST